ncbi:MAG TPA: Tol-Pal system beta propeller repeat protein TolB [Acidobacteria bacterium]|nr:Tol-Pal system beta propeller repeat protein TolB [Acidobacteriota bacterium]
MARPEDPILMGRPRMTRSDLAFPRCSGWLLLAWLLTAPLVTAQSDPGELTGVISGRGAAKISIAVPPTTVAGGARDADAAELGQVLRDDLDFSGWFGLLDPRGEGRIPVARLGDATAWREVGAAYLLNSTLRRREGRAVFEVRLIETGGGEKLLHRQWGGELPRDLRRLAHAASDAVVATLTGQPGLAQTKIAFVSRHGEGKEVYLMDYDGARVRRLTNTGTINLTPSWSADARRLTFLSYLGRKPSIYLLTESGEVTTLHPRGGDLNAAPDFSPDGRTLVFSSDRDGNTEIYLYDLETGRETRLTRNPAIDTAPCWSPSGREIAFTSDRSGTPQIYLMKADGSDQRRLTWEGRYNESAAWSPDGSRIAFVSRIAGQFEIVIHDLASARETIITSGPGKKENPRWAPDGRHLVFASNRTGMYSIYTIRDDGSDLRRLTRGRESFTPDWSPIRK